ncbi:hypothetical protein [Umezawaea tangerina]|uniref:Uncharacterized protein n=1 Tax=Umezawaea tangerina TaxID=84725 RepID=A0A2T0SPJ6_9PSEU|nr:hypothetical protein [Umezawaea tangerina]PRY35334.1 hypothetical protein CLV43_114252 [Umezawaea tangerina]
MTVESGLGWSTFSVDDASGTPCDLRSCTTNLEFATPRAVQDVTALTMSANARLALLADASITATLVFDDSAGKGHSVFKTVPSTSVPRTTSLGVSGQTLAMEMLYTDYPFGRAQTGELTHGVPGVLADGAVPTWS